MKNMHFLINKIRGNGIWCLHLNVNKKCELFFTCFLTIDKRWNKILDENEIPIVFCWVLVLFTFVRHSQKNEACDLSLLNSCLLLWWVISSNFEVKSQEIPGGGGGYLKFNDRETQTWYVYNLYVPIIKVVEMQRFIRVIIGRYVSSRKFQKSYSTFRIDQFTTSSKSFRLKGNQDSSTIGRWLQHIREGTHWNIVIYMWIFTFFKCLLIQNKGRRIFLEKKLYSCCIGSENYTKL